jgi:hypothetical protein
MGKYLMKTLVPLTIMLLLFSNDLLACGSDTDCSPGSQCIKSPGNIYGICIGSIEPGNSHDKQPVSSPIDPNGTTGDTCSFDTNCGPGSKCLKSSSSIYGACVHY